MKIEVRVYKKEEDILICIDNREINPLNLIEYIKNPNKNLLRGNCDCHNYILLLICIIKSKSNDDSDSLDYILTIKDKESSKELILDVKKEDLKYNYSLIDSNNKKTVNCENILDEVFKLLDIVISGKQTIENMIEFKNLDYKDESINLANTVKEISNDQRPDQLSI